MQGFKDMTSNTIFSEQETREFLIKHLEDKNGEGSNHGLPHEERKSPKGFLFSSNGPDNRPTEFKKESSSQSRPTMTKFLDEKIEYLEIQNENIATVEDKHAEYLTLNEECRRNFTFKELCDL